MDVKVAEIYRQFNPIEPLDADDERYVDCSAVRAVPSLLNELGDPLDDENATIFFSGLTGDGKTTLLQRLRKRLERSEYRVAWGAADQRLHLNDVQSEDVVLLLLAVVEETLQQRCGQGLHDGRLKKIWKDLYRILNMEVEPRQVDVKLPFGQLVLTAKDSSGLRHDFRARLRHAKGPTFVDIANEYLECAHDLIRDREGRRLAVILDGLDRLQGQDGGQGPQDKLLFFGQSSELPNVRCRVIYTINLTLAFGDGPRLGSLFGQRPVVAPMVPVTHRDRSPHAEGIGKLREIVERRLLKADSNLEEAFERRSTVDELIRVSGGYLRDLMLLVRAACTEARRLPMSSDSIARAIGRFQASQWEAGQRYIPHLRRVIESQLLADLELDDQQALLANRLVYVYFDHNAYWYDVCPSVRERIDSTV